MFILPLYLKLIIKLPWKRKFDAYLHIYCSIFQKRMLEYFRVYVYISKKGIIKKRTDEKVSR